MLFMISSVLPCQRIVKAISFFVCLFAINFAAAQTATITTDQPDYPPGSTVILMGSGFAAGDTVRLQVLHVGDGDNETSGAHAPWIVVADDNGNFTTTWIVPPDEDELGATLLTTADGQTSGLHAETTFTDALRTDTYPSAFSTFTGGNSYCLNATTSNLTANWTNTVCNGTLNGNNTNVGITITWFKNTANSTTGGTQVQQTTTNAGTTSSTFTPSSAVAGTVYYYVTVSWSAGPNCAPSGSITSGTQAVTINPLPTNKTPVAAQSSVCSGSSTTIQIASSEAGVDYQLRNNAGNINVGAAVSGNGGIIDLPTGNLTANTTFNVLAKNATTTCSVQLTPTVTVTVNPLPNNASNSFSSNTICNGR
jgi:Ig-like domain-containing protein